MFEPLVRDFCDAFPQLDIINFFYLGEARLERLPAGHHVIDLIGETVFACAIHSQDSEMTQHDWRRYDFANVLHEPYQLPSTLEQKLIALLKFWGLNYGAIDLIRTPGGQYVFLEINPSGQWGWIEDITGMPISKAIAETLISAPRGFGAFPWH